MSSKGLSLWLVVLMNLNVVLGSALFIGIPKIANIAGPWAGISWLLCGLLFLPILLVFANFAQLYPFAGGVYVYVRKTLGDGIALLCGWSYFCSLTAANVFVAQGFCNHLKELFVMPVSVVTLCLLLIVLFSFIALKGVELLETLQVFISGLKFIPLLIVLLAGGITLYLHGVGQPWLWPCDSNWVAQSFPITVFGFVGIEVCCSIAHMIQDGQKNTSKALIISWLLITATYGVIQLAIQFIFNHQVVPAQAFVLAVEHLPCAAWLQVLLKGLVHIGIMASYLGGAYSVFFANNWNFYAMVKDLKLDKFSRLAKLNEFGQADGAVVLQAGLMMLLLLLPESVLLVIADVTNIVAYALVGYAGWWLAYHSKTAGLMGKLIALSCLGSCLILAKILLQSSQQLLWLTMLLLPGALYHYFASTKPSL